MGAPQPDPVQDTEGDGRADAAGVAHEGQEGGISQAATAPAAGRCARVRTGPRPAGQVRRNKSQEYRDCEHVLEIIQRI